MNAAKLIFAAVILGLFSSVDASQRGGMQVTYFEPLQRLEIRSASASADEDSSGSAVVRLSFDAMGQSFDLLLEPNRNFLSASASASLPDTIGIYRGRLAGHSDSWARIVVHDGEPTGMFFDGSDLYAIEPPGDSAVDSDSVVVYRLADTFIQPGAMSCGSHQLMGNGAGLYKAVVAGVGGANQQGPGAVSEIDIGAVGDFEFTSAAGGNAAAEMRILARLNMVDGIYSQDLGIQINVPLVETFSDAADPFSDETDAGSLLNELRSYRQNTPAQNALGLTHLYTGRDLNGSTVGVAFDNVLCRTGAGAGLSEGNGSAAFDSLVAAHEIGHNFGAPHDGVPGACEAEPMTFIMAPQVNGSTEFSQCSISIMQANAAAASCVTALPTVDMSVALSGQPATVLLSNSPELTIDLSNNGASTATNVVADITLPSNVTFVSAVASSGSCSNGAGGVNCLLGDVPGLSARTITLTTDATSVGSGSFDVTVTSDVDERPTNNQQSVMLTVDPAVDLAYVEPPRLTVNLDQSGTISGVVENRSVLDATGVVMTISFGNGLRPDTAVWSAGTCTVGTLQIDCQASNVAGLSSSTLDIGVTGTLAGSRSYAVVLSSNEADAVTSDNNVTDFVTVNDPSDDDDGGSGAIQWLFWMLMGAAALLARRRAAVFRH
ncbi:MAG: M12 family metallo-peptidase [Woeseiaceae bacterium]|nr:M12 family metallo-peptidase [Woeseiaceae bacterium]